ncbi:MAG: hypothetical protein V7788_01790 [Alphaproteobacteria bacterium]
MQNLMRAVAIIVMLVSFSTTAQADAIDGNWCHSEFGNFEIRGSNILTPGGLQMTGEYSRHTFRYIAPPGERAATKAINMAIVDDETLHLIVEEPDSSVEVWRRCHVNVSSAGSLDEDRSNALT